MSNLELDGTIESLDAYLRVLEGCYGPEQPSKERLLQEHGRRFESGALTKEEHEIVTHQAAKLGTPLDRFERKQCFANSQRLVAAGPDGPLVYVEGFVYPKSGIPIHHGWVGINGKVVDVTLPDRATGSVVLGEFSERIYVGILFGTRCVRAEMLRTLSASTLLEDAIGLGFDNDRLACRIQR